MLVILSVGVPKKGPVSRPRLTHLSEQPTSLYRGSMVKHRFLTTNFSPSVHRILLSYRCVGNLLDQGCQPHRPSLICVMFLLLVLLLLREVPLDLSLSLVTAKPCVHIVVTLPATNREKKISNIFARCLYGSHLLTYSFIISESHFCR